MWLQRRGGAPQAGHRSGRGLVRPQDDLDGLPKLCVQVCKCDLRKQGASDGGGLAAPPPRHGPQCSQRRTSNECLPCVWLLGVNCWKGIAGRNSCVSVQPGMAIDWQ